MPYNLAELNAFLAVVEEGSIGRAAERLSVTQPALSRIVKRLESDVGEPLFERHSGGMRITAFGKALFPHARLLQQEEILARTEMNQMRGLATGTLRLGVTAGASASFLQKTLASFLEQWPGIAVEVFEGVWDQLADALGNYRVDLVLAPKSPANIHFAVAKNCHWNEPMWLIVGSDHPLRTKESVRLEDLVEQRWCFVPNSTEPFKLLLSLYEKRGIAPPRMAVSSISISLLKSLVAHAGFVSWLTAPMYAAEKALGLIHEIPVDGLNHVRKFVVYHRLTGVLPRPALRFVEEVRSVAAKL